MSLPAKKITTITACLIGATLLLSYILSVPTHIGLPVGVFWVSICLILGSIMFQIMAIKMSLRFIGIILFEIVATSFLFHMIYFYQFYGLIDYDTYANLISTKAYLTRSLAITPNMIGTYYWPMLHMLGAVIYLITNVDLLVIAKWLPAALDAGFIVGFYLLIYRIFGSHKTALVAALLIASIQQHIDFSAQYVCETIGLVSAVYCLYFYFSARKSNIIVDRVKYDILAIIMLFVTILGHHFTSSILISFIAIHVVVSKLLKYKFITKIYQNVQIDWINVSFTFLVIGAVGLLSYWLYVNTYPLVTLANFTQGVFFPSQWTMPSYGKLNNIATSSPITIHGKTILYGFYFFHFAFGLVLLYEMFPKLKHRFTEILSFGIFALLCAFVAFLFLYIIPANISSLYPDRIITYFWFFAAGPILITTAIIENRWYKRGIIALVCAFLLFNIYMIPPQIINPGFETVSIGASREDYALAKTIDFEGSLEGQDEQLMAIWDSQSVLGSDASLSNAILENSTKNDILQYDWIIISEKWLLAAEKLPSGYQKAPQFIGKMRQLLSDSPPAANKIYCSNDLSAFKINLITSSR